MVEMLCRPYSKLRQQQSTNSARLHRCWEPLQAPTRGRGFFLVFWPRIAIMRGVSIHYPEAMPNALYFGDNLDVLRQSIKDESVDLIYLDPPFNSNANYNVLFRSPTGERSHAQIEAFEDTWHWTDDAEQAFDEVMRSGKTDAAELLRAMRSFLKENDMMAYLAMMAVRFLELHRVLKDTGSLYLHCDTTASHYLKMMLDSVFGPTLFLNEIIWKRTHSHGNVGRNYGS